MWVFWMQHGNFCLSLDQRPEDIPTICRSKLLERHKNWARPSTKAGTMQDTFHHVHCCCLHLCMTSIIKLSKSIETWRHLKRSYPITQSTKPTWSTRMLPRNGNYKFRRLYSDRRQRNSGSWSSTCRHPRLLAQLEKCVPWSSHHYRGVFIVYIGI